MIETDFTQCGSRQLRYWTPASQSSRDFVAKYPCKGAPCKVHQGSMRGCQHDIAFALLLVAVYLVCAIITEQRFSRLSMEIVDSAYLAEHFAVLMAGVAALAGNRSATIPVRKPHSFSIL